MAMACLWRDLVVAVCGHGVAVYGCVIVTHWQYDGFKPLYYKDILATFGHTMAMYRDVKP